VSIQDDDLAFASVAQLSRLLRARRVSASELTRFFLDRLERLGGRYNALAALTRERAEREARRADRILREDARGASPLCGIPYGAKDVLAAKGAPTAWGTRTFRRRMFDYDAAVVERLGEAGAVLLGKLALPHFSGVPSYSSGMASTYGPMRNPWDFERWAGGSSSGSAAAVAAGMTPFSLAAETWGSIVGPAAFSGVTALRPTWGRVSRFGAMPVAWSMDKIGPMAHTAEDCGLIMQVIAGEDRRDATTALRPAFRFHRRPTRRSFRLGVLPGGNPGSSKALGDVAEGKAAAPEVTAAFEEALRVLRHSGMRLRAAKLPRGRWVGVDIPILYCEEAAALQEAARLLDLREITDPSQRRSMKKLRAVGTSFTGLDYARAAEKRVEAIRDIVEFFKDWDALVSPTVYVEAPKVEESLSKAFAGVGGHGSGIGATTGIPELVVPMGFGPNRMPLGLSFLGGLFSEDTLLQIGMIFQRETDWHSRHPAALDGSRSR